MLAKAKAAAFLAAAACVALMGCESSREA